MSLEDAKLLAELKERCGGEETEKKLLLGGEQLDDATLARWLRKRDGDVKAAAKDLKEHATWRAAYVPRGRIYEEEVAEDLSQNKAFLTGYDKTGRPLTLVVVNRHHIKNAEVSKRCIAYALDCASLMGARGPAGAAWDGKMSGIFDLRGLKAANCDFSTLRNVFDLLQNHYPERLHKLWLFCAPVIFYGLWKLVAPFIDPVTRSKVQFVYEKDAAADFAEAFDPSVLPPEIQAGGTGSWVRVDERYRLLLAEVEAERAAAAPEGQAAAKAAVVAPEGQAGVKAAVVAPEGQAAVKAAVVAPEGQAGVRAAAAAPEGVAQVAADGPQAEQRLARPIEVVA